jgi:hypothetical protein
MPVFTGMNLHLPDSPDCRAIRSGGTLQADTH